MLYCSWSEQISGTCKGTYDGESSSYITSPNYPENHGSNDDCTWTITAIDERTILLHFVDFEIYASEFLSIYNGSNNEGILLDVLDGWTTPSDIWLTGKEMHVKFSSNERNNMKGFKILVKIFGK